MKTIKGNLIIAAKQGKFDVIGHGCNCFMNFGAGLAKEIKRAFPRAYSVDCSYGSKGDAKKLGTVSIAHYDKLDIVNCYSQHSYGRGVLVLSSLRLF